MKLGVALEVKPNPKPPHPHSHVELCGLDNFSRCIEFYFSEE
jgi:hypothetical protein